MKKYPLNTFFKIPNLFSQPELSEKNKDRIIFTQPITSHDLSNFAKTFPFSENSGWDNKLRVSKNFLGFYLLAFVEYLCNRSPKKEQTSSKIIQYFDFSYCKLPKLAGCFIPFKFSYWYDKETLLSL